MIAKQILRAVRKTAGISIICVANVNGQSIHPPIGTLLPDPPQVVNSFELQAINDPATGKGAFVFEGHEVPPVVRAVPGGVIQLEYVNQMSRSSSESLHGRLLHEYDEPSFPWFACIARCSLR